MSLLRRSARNRAADNRRLRIALRRFATQDHPPAPVDAIVKAIRESDAVATGNRRTIDVAREANAEEPKP